MNIIQKGQIVDLSKLTEEEQKELRVEFKFYENLGVELKRLNETPKPLGTIKDTLREYGIEEIDIDTIYLMSYDIAKSIQYINDYHKHVPFKLSIYGHEDTICKDLNDARIKQIGTTHRPTEHFNLIKLKNAKRIKTTSFSGQEIDETTEHMLFVEPYHNGIDFGPAYETKLPEDASEYDKQSFELLKAKLFVPNQETIELLQKKFIAA